MLRSCTLMIAREPTGGGALEFPLNPIAVNVPGGLENFKTVVEPCASAWIPPTASTTATNPAVSVPIRLTDMCRILPYRSLGARVSQDPRGGSATNRCLDRAAPRPNERSRALRGPGGACNQTRCVACPVRRQGLGWDHPVQRSLRFGLGDLRWGSRCRRVSGSLLRGVRTQEPKGGTAVWHT